MDFVKPGESSSVLAMPKKLVTCKAGDLVLWDSRTVHCNTPALSTPITPGNRLLRACAYVCMTPKAWADERTLEDRRKGYEIRVTTSHWPHTDVMGFGWARPGPLSYAEAGAGISSLVVASLLIACRMVQALQQGKSARKPVMQALTFIKSTEQPPLVFVPLAQEEESQQHGGGRNSGASTRGVDRPSPSEAGGWQGPCPSIQHQYNSNNVGHAHRCVEPTVSSCCSWEAFGG
eukprot:5087384-Amphidinium_carterae.1